MDAETRWTDRLFDLAQGHFDECNCDSCHAEHDWIELYGSKDFDCCTAEINRRIDSGEWCSKEPIKHGGAHMGDKICWECNQ